jgi:transposase
MARKKRGQCAYATDLTDTQWALIAPLIPEAEPGGRPRKSTSRELVNAILYFLRAGMAWRLLPHDLPPWQTVLPLPAPMAARGRVGPRAPRPAHG